MTTRILAVDYPLAATGKAADADVRLSATVTATAARGQSTGAAVSTTAATTATAAATRSAASSVTTTATVTASATVASPTDISSLIVPMTGVTWGRGSITIPGYDQAYLVNMSDSRFGVNYENNRALIASLPAPSTPDSTHWLSLTVAVADRDRRFTFNPNDPHLKITGTVVEPTTVGTTTVLSLTWDTTAHGWYVSSYTGSPVVREYGPNESTTQIPLYASPETRALGAWATRRDAVKLALTTIPTAQRDHLAQRRVVAELFSTSAAFPETMMARYNLDPSYGSNLSGLFADPYAAAYENVYPGRTTLHELGHAWDRYALGYLGYTYGINPKPPFSPNATDVVYTYYPGGQVYQEYHWFPTYYWALAYDEAGNVIYGTDGLREQFAYLHDESEVIDLLAPLRGSGPYYLSNEAEFTAEQMMLCWGGHDSSLFDSSAFAALGGNDPVHTAFRDYVISIGALPSGW